MRNEYNSIHMYEYQVEFPLGILGASLKPIHNIAAAYTSSLYI